MDDGLPGILHLFPLRQYDITRLLCGSSIQWSSPLLDTEWTQHYEDIWNLLPVWPHNPRRWRFQHESNQYFLAIQRPNRRLVRNQDNNNLTTLSYQFYIWMDHETSHDRSLLIAIPDKSHKPNKPVCEVARRSTSFRDQVVECAGHPSNH